MNEAKHRGKAGLFLVLTLTLIGLLIVALIALIATRKKPRAAPIAEKAAPVEVRKIEPALAPEVVLLPARVEPRFEARLATEKAGVVTEILADKGDAVEAGQPLLRLDDRSWRLLVEKCEIDLREAKRALQRFEEMKKNGAVAVSDFEGIQTRCEMADLSLRDARINLDKCTVKSPAKGVIVARLLERGENAAEGAAAFTVVDAESVKLALDVPERDVHLVRPGQELAFFVDALPGRACTAKVSFVSASAGRESNTFPVELLAGNGDGLLKPGMIARVELAGGVLENAMVIPLQAIIPKMGEHVVFIAGDGKAVRHIVKIESIRGADAVVSSGVSAGDDLVVAGHRALSDGMPIRILGPSDPAETKP